MRDDNIIDHSQIGKFEDVLTGILRDGGHHPECLIQTGIGSVSVRIPKVRSNDGKPAKEFSLSVVKRLKRVWLDERKEWTQRDLSQDRWAYV